LILTIKSWALNDYISQFPIKSKTTTIHYREIKDNKTPNRDGKELEISYYLGFER
jgi:hypothetical protein